jgi:hypothetical protein
MSKKTFLDSIHSPAPCSADWDEMRGDERVRFCNSCEKNVYNLSAMPRREAVKFAARNSGRVCVRYVRLPDGRVLTADTKLYKIAGRASRLAAGALGATLTLSAIVSAQTESGKVKTENQKTETKQNKDAAKKSQISFTIVDPIHEVMPDIQIQLTNEKTKKTFSAVTDSQGTAFFYGVPAGKYEINVAAQKGFSSFSGHAIEIKNSVEPNINIRLDLPIEVIGDIIDTWSEIPLFQAILQKDNETVKQLINSGFDINKKDNHGQTALHVAVHCGNVEIVKLLLSKGAKVNAKDKEKQTPFLMIGGDDDSQAKEIFRLLIDAGADVNVEDEDGETLLMSACEDEELEAVKLLLEAGANPNIKDEDGETAFDKTDSEEIKQLLIRYGARKMDN